MSTARAATSTRLSEARATERLWQVLERQRDQVEAYHRAWSAGADIYDERAMLQGPCRERMTALHAAVATGQVGIATRLIADGVRVDPPTGFHGHTPLHLAARGRHAACCALLLAHGADAEAHSRQGLTPLSEALVIYPWAEADWHPDTASLLLDRGARIPETVWRHPEAVGRLTLAWDHLMAAPATDQQRGIDRLAGYLLDGGAIGAWAAERLSHRSTPP